MKDNPSPPSRGPALLAVLLTTALWWLAVALPVWETRSQYGHWDVVPGALPALIGCLGILVYCPAWFANLLLIPLCIMLFKRRTLGFPLSLIALALAFTAYIMPAIYGDNDIDIIVGRRIGFYLWLGSFLTLALAYALLTFTTQRSRLIASMTVAGLVVLAIGGLELICPVGVSPLETALKDPSDITHFTAILNQHPPQADKDTALWWAVRQNLSSDRQGPSKQVTMLLAAGANPNTPDKWFRSGETLLMRALPPRGSESLVTLLLQAGADVNARDDRGKTVLDVAQEIGSSPQCQKILVDAGARTSGQK